MDAALAPHRKLIAYAPEEAFAPKTRIILRKLGYQILTPEEIGSLPDAETGLLPNADLRIVDERRLGEVPEDDLVHVPMVVLTGRHGVTGADSRIVGALKRPAGIHDLYRLLQQIFEENPRSTPRIPIHLRALCRRGDREWAGTMISLSENGCLLRSPEPLTLGSQLQIGFDLPRGEAIEVWAEIAYQLVPDYGLVFSALAPAHRDAIVSYVERCLAGP